MEESQNLKPSDKSPDDFLSRKLERMGIALDQVNLVDLVVPEGQSYYLGAQEPHLPDVQWMPEIGLHLQTKSIRQVKAWIGMDDEIAKKIPRTPQTISGIMAIKGQPLPDYNLQGNDQQGFSREGPNPIMIARNIRVSAMEYVFGYSPLYAHLEEVLDEFFGEMGIWIPILQDITVERDARLVVGAEGKSLVARDVYIKVGGLIDVQSDIFNFQCNSIQGELP